MKKALAILLVVSAIFLCACSGASNKWKPIAASDDIMPYGEEALQIIEQYLNFEIDADAANDKFGSLSQRMSRIGIDDEDSNYNSADEIIARIVDHYGDFSIEYRSDVSLRQDLDILSVQIKKKPSGKIYDSREFSHLEDDERLGLFIDTQSTSAVNPYVLESDGDYFLTLSFDAMYGTKANAVQTCIEEAFKNADKNGLSLAGVWCSYNYYDQSVFTVSLHCFDSGIMGNIFLDSPENTLGNFSNEAEMNDLLEEAIDFANIK